MRQSINQRFAGMFPKFKPIFGDPLSIMVSEKYGKMSKFEELDEQPPRVIREIAELKKQLIHLLEEHFKIHKVK
jgi:hypothetical protein